ncbi:MAG: hypothetical protein JNN20_10420 [Betaproteobacteria bacterium]|nr:hypothetical protein [Betaproteobacteria bacterium]
MTASHPYYTIWTGALNLGDTPGVFTDATFVGLQLQLPCTISYAPPTPTPLELLLVTTDVEIFEGKRHAIYWGWVAGTPLPAPVGYIDDTDPISGKPEYHMATIPPASAVAGPHWITILVNPAVQAGMRDDFVLRRIEACDAFGVKFGW